LGSAGTRLSPTPGSTESSAPSLPEDAAQIVGDALAYFRLRGVTSFTWWLEPRLEPTIWTQELLAQGFQYDDHTPGMAIDLATLPPPVQHPLTIRRVEDRRTLIAWVHTFIQGYGLPEAMTPSFLALIESLGTNLPFRHYLGFLNDRPVAASTLFLGAGVAGIYNVATAAVARGQGIGSAMTLIPLYEARSMGYRAGVLQSSELGYQVYQRLGFQKFCQMDHFYRQVQNITEPF
jgi:GNAT superfamily N-acetyltransferase